MREHTYHAACLCGTVRYAVDAIPRLATPCICARCRGQGVRMVHVNRDDFTLLVGEDMLTEQMEGARQPHHFFCRRCGEVVFGFLGGGAQVTVNVACLGRGDVETLAVPGRAIRRKKEWEA